MSNENNVLTMRDVIIEASEAQLLIDEHKEGIRKISSSISNHLLTVAKSIGIHEVEGEPLSSLFTTACEVQESFIKSDAAGTHKLDKLPRCWINPKSNIKMAMDLGMDLSKYSTESDLRKDLTKLRNAQTVMDDSKSDKVEAIPQAIIDSENHVFTSSINALLETLAMASKSDEAVIADIVDEIEATIDTIKLLMMLVPEEPTSPEEIEEVI